ncbi:holo-ACP synthase [Candidatus Kapaibacterium sp.]
MIYGIGTDIIETSRIQSAVEKYGDRFLSRIYTPLEIEYCNSFNDTRFIHFAARFAAKESFSKAIGTGITQGFKFKEISIQNLESGKPEVILDGELKNKYGHLKIHISLSHSDTNSVAFLILENVDDKIS